MAKVVSRPKPMPRNLTKGKRPYNNGGKVLLKKTPCKA